MKRSAATKLTIYVNAVDSHPPTIETTSLIGYVPENSQPGTPVLSLEDSQPIRFIVSDPDLVNRYMS